MPNLEGSRPKDLSCSLNASSFCPAAASGAMIGIQPSPSLAARVMAASDEPPNQIGIGRCTGRRQDAHFLEIVKPPLETDEILRPEAAEHLDLLGLPRPARLPLHAERLILDMVPSDPDAEPEAPAAEEIDLRRLLGDDPGLPLRSDQDAAGEPDLLRDGGQKAERDEGLVESVLFTARVRKDVSSG